MSQTPIPKSSKDQSNTEKETQKGSDITEQSQSHYDAIINGNTPELEYQCDPSIVKNLKNPNLALQNPSPRLWFSAACSALHEHQASPEGQEAREKLSSWSSNFVHSGSWSGDPSFKIFYDLNLGFFGNMLFGNVFLCWGTGKSSLRTVDVKAPGEWVDNGIEGRRVRIALNANVLILKSQSTINDLLCAMVRGMMAYFIITTDFKDPLEFDRKNFLKSLLFVARNIDIATDFSLVENMDELAPMVEAGLQEGNQAQEIF